jgi:predicted DCC family thiol-disulfide oxidoreductase YuxK
MPTPAGKSRRSSAGVHLRTRSSRRQPMTEPRPLVLLYDNDCGFCRWSVAWILRRIPCGALDPMPIQSESGQELLADIPAESRLASAWAVQDGHLSSGGDALIAALALAPRMRSIAKLAMRRRSTVNRMYSFVAANRHFFTRLLTRDARRHADDFLACQGHYHHRHR